MKTKLYKFAINVIFSSCIFVLQSQAQQVRIFNSENSGLPENYVTSIAIDAEGNKWFGTWYGDVVKFDNVHWTVYESNKTGIPKDHGITSIAIDAVGNKWFGTHDIYNANGGGGLVKFDNINWTIYDTSNSGLPNNTIWDVDIDLLGNKWICTGYGGVAKFDDFNWTVFNHTNSGLPDNHVWAITIDTLGNKWFATDLAKVAKFDDINWTIYDYSNSALLPYDNNVSSILIDDEGNKWFGMGLSWDTGAEGGLAKFDDENWSFFNHTNSDLRYSVFSAAKDNKGNIWFGTSNWTDAAVVKIDGTNWTVYNNTNSDLPNDCVYSIAIDDLGNKWFATANSGVIVFNENAITTGLKDNLTAKTDDFTVYPNPAKDFISIEGLQSGTFEVFNSAGSVLRNFEVDGALTKVDISNLPDGIYTIRVKTDNGIVAKKFAKGY